MGGEGHEVHVFDDATHTADDPAAVATAQVGVQLHVGRLLVRRRILEADHCQLLHNTASERVGGQMEPGGGGGGGGTCPCRSLESIVIRRHV